MWGGRGPKPAWLRIALEQGKRLEDFSATKLDSHAPGSRRSAARKGRAPKKNVVAVKYRDKDGNTWTGRGTKPRWLSAAIDAGAKQEEFLIVR